MRSKPRHSSRLALHPIRVACAIAFIVVFLAFGYHMGVRNTERGFQSRLVELRTLESELKVALRVCKSETQKLIDSERLNNNRVHAMIEAVAALEADQKTEENAYRAIEIKRENCTATLAQVRRRVEEPNEKDTLVRLEVEELKRDIDALHVFIQKITRGEGMHIVMLNQGLQRLRSFYTNWCSRTPGCVELTDSELIERWGNATADEAIMKEFVARDEEAQRTMASNAFPGLSANATDIVFQPTLAEEGDALTVPEAPVFFNRSIHDKPLRGMDKATMPLSPMRVTTAFERFTDYGLCAYRHHNPNFTFQSDFKYLSETMPLQVMQLSEKRKDVAYLHELVASPLLRFCVDCNAATWAEHYKVACLKDRVQLHYGTHDFWAARSLIQASPSVREAAFLYYKARDWHKKKILAVVLHQTFNHDRFQCDNLVDRKYGLHYQYLRANYPNITGLRQHVSDDRHAQCSPLLDMVIEHIQKVRDQAPYIFDHVYLSMAEDQRSTLESLLSVNDVTQLRPLLLPAYTNAEAETATPGFTELVDLEIAGRATDILVNPFLSSSRYVTECFLLRNKLAPGDHVWTF
ncbi:conserved hypothetical protein [Leishmania major strain Friedlin]|uniref:Uncharacterized protein n=1 Tax=Leishmania major TaxID=5664 RepID=E9AEY1_LEIMA|nr:conserved hypothetical protein [Leishmania major strain Friedlin]CAG9582510.1 hypothetical_protein_-_conserved [Leishmania major strain Friedlin]CBZ12785.1 conserved hypothetical protein [Leishmania major strain Friedlin]|eukprot:XP_003722551.1 conserved hypothetical protein [Leishmania major strain Friedlin]